MLEAVFVWDCRLKANSINVKKKHVSFLLSPRINNILSHSLDVFDSGQLYPRAPGSPTGRGSPQWVRSGGPRSANQAVPKPEDLKEIM